MRGFEPPASTSRDPPFASLVWLAERDEAILTEIGERRSTACGVVEAFADDEDVAALVEAEDGIDKSPRKT